MHTSRRERNATPRGAARAVAALLLGLLVAGSASAAPDYSWYAGDVGAGAGSWTDEASQYAYTVNGATLQTGVSAAPGISAAYRFDGTDSITGLSFEEFGTGSAPDLSTSFELWLRPTDLVGQEVLFETGGTADGLSFTLNASVLQFRIKDSGDSLTLTTDLTSVMTAGEFIQIVGTFTVGSAARLFVNGSQVAVSSPGAAAGILDWSSNNDTGIGAANGRVGGSVGSGPGTLNTYGAFQGDISRIAFWEDYVLSGAEVQSRWLAISGGAIPVPEPGTGVLVYGGLLILAARRRIAS